MIILLFKLYAYNVFVLIETNHQSILRARPTDSRSDIRKENHECRKKAETVVPADAISRKRPGSHQERDARDPRHKKKRSERE